MKYIYAILCNGDFPKNKEVLKALLEADELICCDGAADSVLPFRMPDAVVGDLDSLSSESLEILKDRIVRVEEQETNDLSKAFRYVCERIGSKVKICKMTDGEIFVKIFGATGKREDHTIGNISLLPDFLETASGIVQNVALSMITDYGIFLPLVDSVSMDIPEGKEISIFSFDPTLKIASSGLRYPTDGIVLDMWWKATLNCIEKSPITLQFSHKAKALIFMSFNNEV